MSHWSNGSWSRLNMQPLRMLPDSEGMTAQKRFQTAASELHQKIRSENFWDTFVMIGDHTASGIRYDRNTLDRRKEMGDNSGGFSYSSPYEGPFPPVYIFNTRKIKYKADCSDDKEELKEEFFAARIAGYFKIDWDEDGDLDLAVLLERGGYIFFRHEACLHAAVHSSFIFLF